MPKLSSRKNWIGQLQKQKHQLEDESMDDWLDMLVFQEWPSIGLILAEDNEVMTLMFEWLFSEADEVGDLLQRVINSRYISSRIKDLSHEEYSLGHLLSLSPKNLQQVVRTTREGFLGICNLIKNSNIFHNNSTCAQLDICQQLALTLERLGMNGTRTSVGRLARLYCISRGGVVMASGWVIEAIYQIGGNYLRWPNLEERQEISSYMAGEGFPGCIGFLDGTTFPLYQRPGLDGKVFFDCKSRY
ncbi:hypothetical protein O181_087942 [Austropuccinia psidii MF-1]|uniref:Uncharacterized protein n=1 Tax=Austropuccinia psidii MF-1 TaxID=1389203 RepID=A0A9Q3P445_9BASI|nr:hypothetical protein [Austropuccinia psidii MF-1]